VNATQVGLDFADVAQEGSALQQAISAQSSYFSFYGITVSTLEGDYSTREFQQWLPNFYDSIMATSKVLNGSGTAWTEVMLSWGVPSTPNYNLYAPGGICNSDSTRTYGDCGLKYNCTVVVDNPSVTKDKQVPFFAQEDFYRCVNLWINSDLAYDALQPGLILVDPSAPRGQRQLYFSAPNKVPFSTGQLITYGLSENADFVELIDQVRAVVDNVTNPAAIATGQPFDFWSQYVNLLQVIDDAIGWALLLCFCLSTLLLGFVPFEKRLTASDDGATNGKRPSFGRRLMVGLWGAVIITLVVCMVVFEAYGFFGYAGITLSAIPGVSIIMASALAIDGSGPMTLAFVNTPASLDSKEDRLKFAFRCMLAPVVDGYSTAFVGIIMISASPITFIVKFLFLPFLLILLFAAINGLIVLPFLLITVGPPSLYSPYADSEATIRQEKLDPKAVAEANETNLPTKTSFSEIQEPPVTKSSNNDEYMMANV